MKLRHLTRGLRWRLTISYVLVTVTAALAMSATSAIVQTADGQGQGDSPGAADVLAKSAARAAPYLSTAHASTDTVDATVAAPVFGELSRQFPGHTVAVAVLNADGRLLDATNCALQPSSGTSPAQCQATATARLGPLLDEPTVTAAVTTAISPASQGAGGGDVGGQGFLVASVPGNGKQPAGALLAMFDGSPPAGIPANTLTSFLTQWRMAASLTWLPLLLAILILGTATGLLLSGRLIRRLRIMALTVRVWSRGDLTASADTDGFDELSALAGDLNHMAEQLRNLLAARKTIAKAEERHHVRRELHDGVKQELFAVTMHLAAASVSLNGTNNDAATHLTAARQAAEHAQSELTAIINEQPPPTLAAGDLPTALAVLAADFEQRARIPLILTVSLGDSALSEENQRAVYRVVQEALTNIRRHADADTASLTITATSTEVSMHITDDGAGISPDQLAGGTGLNGIRERVDMLGGTLTITSDAGGTHLRVRLPVHDDAASDG